MTEEILEWKEIIQDLNNINEIVLTKFPPYNSNKKPPNNFKNLVGKTFGKLTVLYRGENGPRYKVTWICQCSCSNHTIIKVLANNLLSGNTHSCGCYKKEQTINRCKKVNEYDLTGEYGIGYCYNSNIKFFFDLEDYDKIKDYCWHYSERGYIETRIDGKIIKMHRIIMGVKDPKIEVDHIFHDKNGNPRTYDNRKSNLRICVHQKNLCNTKLRSDNTSGATGVNFDKRKGQWRARISYCGKEYLIGYFTNKNDAIEARKQKEIELFREYQYKEYNESGD